MNGSSTFSVVIYRVEVFFVFSFFSLIFCFSVSFFLPCCGLCECILESHFDFILLLTSSLFMYFYIFIYFMQVRDCSLQPLIMAVP